MGKEDKAFYDKKIVYLDYLENGEKIKNGGFVKWDVRGEDCRIQIHIRGLYTTDTLQGEIKLISRQETYGADRIGLQFGTGEYASHWKNSDLAGTGIPYTECDGILIKLSDSRALKGQWRERARAEEQIPQEISAAPEPVQEVVKETLKAAQSEGEETVQSKAAVMESSEVTEVSAVTEAAETKGSEVEMEEASEDLISEDAEAVQSESAEAGIGKDSETEDIGHAETVISNQQRTEDAGQSETIISGQQRAETSGQAKTETVRRPETETVKQPETSNFPLSQNKWEQLERIYPKIHPFGDSREYLSVTPRDFVVLPKQYQELVQNSFLLHGYYNYGHLILTKIMEAEEERYYLGVPGAYYDREKQAALMFGFEGFEAGTDKMEDGGFGYYMKRVEI